MYVCREPTGSLGKSGEGLCACSTGPKTMKPVCMCPVRNFHNNDWGAIFELVHPVLLNTSMDTAICAGKQDLTESESKVTKIMKTSRKIKPFIFDI